jgi:pimeloyl-ACP methyl ester carboxylesterase
MSKNMLGAATLAVIIAILSMPSGRAVAREADFTPVPCADREWTYDDPTFEPLAGAKAFSGRYDGGLYRIEIPDNWNGELVLWAHGFVDDSGAQGARLRVAFPGVGRGSPLREHLVKNGFAWAASSYRCNGYVPGVGLLDTKALTGVFLKSSAGRTPTRVYLSGVSMGGHVTLLGLQEFPKDFAGGLAMCASGPGEMDFLTAVAAASELITGQTISDATREPDIERLTALVGKPPAYTDKGRQLASVQIEISGGPRPFAVEGLETRVIDNVSAGSSISSVATWGRAATNANVKYAIDETLGLTADALNARVRRKAADPEARGPRDAYAETIPFHGRIEQPLMTLHGTGDLYVPISLERTLKSAIDASGRSQLLAQRVIRSAGHCSFSPPEQTRAFDDLTRWVRGGPRADGDDILGDLSNAGLKFTDPLRPGDPGTRKP